MHLGINCGILSTFRKRFENFQGSTLDCLHNVLTKNRFIMLLDQYYRQCFLLSKCDFLYVKLCSPSLRSYLLIGIFKKEMYVESCVRDINCWNSVVFFLFIFAFFSTNNRSNCCIVSVVFLCRSSV